MKRFAVILLLLAACKPEAETAIPDPITMSDEAIGHFCQMNLSEHDGPKAQVHMKDVMDPLFFSQVRDAIAFDRMPEQEYDIVRIYVSDMGAPGATWAEPGVDNWIAAEDALFVRGSSRAGGMGAPELVPFSDRAIADAFAATYGGEVVTLDQITDAEVLSAVPDAPPPSPEDEADYLDRIRRLNR